MGDVFRQFYTRNGQSKALRKWYGEVPDPKGGKPKRVALSPDKQVARTMLRDLERKSERQKAGIIEEFDDTRQTPLSGLVKEYLDNLSLKGDGSRHIADTTRLLNTVIRVCGFATVADLRADSLDRFLANLKSRGRSARTVNTYRQAATGFGNWLVRPKRAIRFNPLADSTKAQGATKVKRRALRPEALARLFEVARDRPLIDRQTVRRGKNRGTQTAQLRPKVRAKLERQGRLRVLLYRTAFYTGLRRNELRQMEARHLIFDDGDPRVELPETITKNQLAAKLPIRSELAADLSAWIRDEGIEATAKVFPVGRDVAKYLKRDLKAAGIPVFDERGRIFDFHAFRTCTSTYMNRSGVPITTAKEMLRHSTIELTAGVYNDGDLHNLREAIKRLPTL